MAHNYYQQAQYYQPQNIYQQLGRQQPQPQSQRTVPQSLQPATTIPYYPTHQHIVHTPFPQRRPLPLPAQQSPTRSRPLPAPTPGPPKSRSPSPVKPTVEPPKRVRASPPKFSPISPPSSPKKSLPAPLPPNPIPDPVSSPQSSPTKSKFVPVWKRTLPDVLPPLLPTPPPNPAQQPQKQNQQLNHTLNQGAPPPPIPLHTRPPKADNSGTVTNSASHAQWNQPRPNPNTSHLPSSESDEEEGEEDEDDSEYSYDYSDEEVQSAKEPPSPQYGIRDLPTRSASVFPSPDPLPQPPPMVRRGGFPSNSTSNFTSHSGFSGGSAPHPPDVKTRTWDMGTERAQSRTMRIAAGATASALGSGSSMDGKGHGKEAWPGNMPRLPKAPETRYDTFDLDDIPPPRSPLMSRRDDEGNAQAPAPAKRRELPTTPQASTNGKQRQRPQSQIYTAALERQNSEKRRPQSQIFHSHVQPGLPPLQRAQPNAYEPRQHDPRQSPTRQQYPREYQQPLSASQPTSPPPVIAISIESPAPVGGRDKLADIDMMESEGSRTHISSPPIISIDRPDSKPGPRQGGVPIINVEGADSGGRRSPQINIIEDGGGGRGKVQQQVPQITVFEVPGISVAGPGSGPEINVSAPGGKVRPSATTHSRVQTQAHPQRRGGLVCGGCSDPIVGRIVNAMGQRWHPSCFRCTVCDELLEHVSSYEWEGKAYCHLDYHENFAPKCYSCKTPIVEERFISLDDPALGKRTYHEQHFFCAECGDPFLAPSNNESSSRTGEFAVSGDGDYASDDVGFTVYRGHPYCEACHVRLRLPKCKRCKRSIRDSDEAVEALGGKWCWKCFVCKRCERPFEDPSFFQRGDDPYCESCFSLILRNEV